MESTKDQLLEAQYKVEMTTAELGKQEEDYKDKMTEYADKIAQL